MNKVDAKKSKGATKSVVVTTNLKSNKPAKAPVKKASDPTVSKPTPVVAATAKKPASKKTTLAKSSAPAAPAKPITEKKAPIAAPAKNLLKTAKPTDAAASKPKAVKEKLVRDSFTMPEAEYAVLSQVKKSCLKAGVHVKKSELLRIGVALLSQLGVVKLKAAIEALPQLKSGRPKKG